METNNPKPLKLTPKGIYDIYDYVSDVVAADTEHFISEDLWEQVCLLVGIKPQKPMFVPQQPPKPLAHSRALVACAAVAVDLVVPMASPPPPTSAPAPGSVGLRPPAPPLPVPRAPLTPAYDWAKLAQQGSGPVPVLTGQVANPRGTVASALAEPRGVGVQPFGDALPPAALAAERLHMKRDSDGQPKATPQKKEIPLRQGKLSSFPLEQVPAALAAGTAVAATAGFEQTKGLASLLALMVLMGTAQQMMMAQNGSARNLMKNLAWTISFFGLRDCVSWAFTASNDISSASASLADFRQATSSSTRSPAP